MTKNYSPFKLLYCVLLATFFFLSPAKATHITGLRVTYQHIDSMKYVFKTSMYRDCRGVPSSLITTSVRCNNGTSTGITRNPTRVAIRDVTEVCDTIPKPCNPPNTRTSAGLEEHIFLDTIDFNDPKFKALLKCSPNCEVIYEVSRCCRNGAINTGPSNTNFYTFAMLRPCLAGDNNSPTFNSNPHNFICCNQPVYKNINPVEPDGDSLSFSLVSPLSGWGKNIPYTKPWSATTPFTVYDPTGTGYANPNVNPPLGMFVDPKTGDVVFTPTNCNQVTVMVMEVKEWRKDTAGIYQHIGTTREDVMYWVQTCPANNTPIIGGPYSYSVCEQDSLCFTITTKDKPKVLPGKPAPPQDTVRLTWTDNIPGATFTRSHDTIALQSAKFCWAPPLGTARSRPYRFTVTALDDACPIRAKTSRAFTVKVKPRMKGTTKVSALSCNRYALDAIPDPAVAVGTPSFRRTLLDSAGNTLFDQNIAQFVLSGSFLSNQRYDTLKIYKTGKYIVKSTLDHLPNRCPIDYYDTIKSNVINVISVDIGRDTFVCQNTTLTLQPQVKSSILDTTLSYMWQDSSTGKTYPLTMGGSDSLKFISITVIDTNGCQKAFDATTVLKREPLKVRTLSNKRICFGDTLHLMANDSIPHWIPPYDTTSRPQIDTIYRGWYKGNKLISTAASISVTEKDNYSLVLDDSLGCRNVSSFTLAVNDSIPITFVPKYNLCVGDKIVLKTDSIPDPLKNKTIEYEWYEKIPGFSPRNFGTFKDTTLIASKTISYILKLSVTQDSVKCEVKDSTEIVVNAIPKATIDTSVLDDNLSGYQAPPYLFCANRADIHLKANQNGGKWTLQSPTGLTDSVFSPSKALKDSVLDLFYAYTDSNGCVGRDTTSVRVIAKPSLQKSGDTLTVTPGSAYEWYEDQGTTVLDSVRRFVAKKNGKYYARVKYPCGWMNSDTMNVIVGSVDPIQKHSIRIYPNPANTFLYVEMENNTNAEFCLMDLAGKCVLREKLSGERTRIDLSSLSSGSYLVSIASKGSTSYHKLIIEQKN